MRALLLALLIAVTSGPVLAATTLIFDGAEGQVKLRSIKGHTWYATIGVEKPDPPQLSCGGFAEGPVTFAPDPTTAGREQSYSGILKLPDRADGSGAIAGDTPTDCLFSLTIVGRTISVDEGEGCQDQHGADCDMNLDHLQLQSAK